MSKMLELAGERFGLLTVLKLAEVKKGSSHWECQCECGNRTIVKGVHLVNGNTKSCGCLKKTAAQKAGQANIKHGKTNTRIWKTWHSMKERCFNQTCEAYKNYGARGITVCDEWLNSFQAFYEWAMSNGYEAHLTIDRIDVNGDYCPENCRWADMKAQSNNRRSNHVLEYKGESHTMSEWSQITGIKKSTILKRLKYGWTIEKALTKNVKGC